MIRELLIQHKILTFKIFIVSFLLLLNSIKAVALSSDSIVIELSTAPEFVLDHNKPCEEGPSAAHIGIRVRNISMSDTLINVTVSFTSLTSTASRSEITSDSILYLRNLKPGQESVAYFYVKYPCDRDIGTTFNFDISDNDTGVVKFSKTIFTRSFQSASAAGQVVDRRSSTSAVYGAVYRYC